jgi:hypothetical protein
MRVTRDGSSPREGKDGSGGSDFGGVDGSPAARVDKRVGGEGGALTASVERKKGGKKGTTVTGAASFRAVWWGDRGGSRGVPRGEPGVWGAATARRRRV